MIFKKIAEFDKIKSLTKKVGLGYIDGKTLELTTYYLLVYKGLEISYSRYSGYKI